MVVVFPKCFKIKNILRCSYIYLSGGKNRAFLWTRFMMPPATAYTVCWHWWTAQHPRLKHTFQTVVFAAPRFWHHLARIKPQMPRFMPIAPRLYPSEHIDAVPIHVPTRNEYIPFWTHRSLIFVLHPRKFGIRYEQAQRTVLNPVRAGCWKMAGRYVPE